MESHQFTDNPEIRVVFVHLGDSPAEHLWLNIKRHLTIFPQIPVHLIYSSTKHEKKIPSGCHRFFMDASALDPRLKQNRDVIFRRGFWSHTLARLYSIPVLHEQFPDDSLLHVESDVLLMPDFPWNDFKRLTKMAWQQFNLERDVASLLFLPNRNTSRIFSESLRRNLSMNSAHTDMTILRQITIESPRMVEYLPILYPGIPRLSNPLFQDIRQIESESQNSVFWGKGIFDSAAIGMWLLGHDPRNTYGKFLLHDLATTETGQTPLNPQNVKYELTSAGHLKIFKDNLDDGKIPLWSLHVHSKEKLLFSENWLKKLESYVDSANTNPGLLIGFRINSVLSMFMDNLWTRTPHRFFFGFPIVHRFRHKLLKLIGRSPYA